MPAGRDRTRRHHSGAWSLEAKEAIILRRETHLDQLTDKLKEPRVRRVIEPILIGDDVRGAAAVPTMCSMWWTWA